LTPKKIALFLLLLTFTLSCKKNRTPIPGPGPEKPIVPADLRWKQLKDIPFTGRTKVYNFSIGTKAYVLGGLFLAGRTREVWEYDSSTDNWTQKASYPGNAYEELAGFVINNKAYVGTGVGDKPSPGYPANNDFYEYDPNADKWTKKADFPGEPRVGAVSFQIDGKGYLGVGSDTFLTKKFDDFWSYNPVNDTWARIADYPGVGQYFNIAFASNSKGYVGWGVPMPDRPDGDADKDLWEYDPIGNKWTKKADFPATTRTTTVDFFIGGNYYVGTGYLTTKAVANDFWKYSVTSNAWSKETEYPDVVGFGMINFTIGNTFYTGAGGTYLNDNSGKIYKHFWKFAP
jgi:N-acetylneuraminic acid mutarotase